MRDFVGVHAEESLSRPHVHVLGGQRVAGRRAVAHLVGAAGAQATSEEERGLHQRNVVVLHQEHPQPITEHCLSMGSAVRHMQIRKCALSWVRLLCLSVP